MPSNRRNCTGMKEANTVSACANKISPLIKGIERLGIGSRCSDCYRDLLSIFNSKYFISAFRWRNL